MLCVLTKRDSGKPARNEFTFIDLFAGASIKDIAARERLSKIGVQKIVMNSFDTF